MDRSNTPADAPAHTVVSRSQTQTPAEPPEPRDAYDGDRESLPGAVGRVTIVESPANAPTVALLDMSTKAIPNVSPMQRNPSMTRSLLMKIQNRTGKVWPNDDDETTHAITGASSIPEPLGPSVSPIVNASVVVDAAAAAIEKHEDRSDGGGGADGNDGGDDHREPKVRKVVDGSPSVSRSMTKVSRRQSNLGDEPPADEKQLARVAELMDKDVMVLNETQLARIQQRNAHPFTISVHSAFRHWWDFFISISTAYVILTTPVRVGFKVSSRGPAYVLDVLVDIMYLLEIVLSLFTSYIDDTTGEEVKKLSSIRRNYLSGFFIIDAISSFPTSLTGSDNALLNLVKLLKVARVLKLSETGLFKTISKRVNRSMNPSLLRMLSLTFLFLLSQHFIACSYYFISLRQSQWTTWQPSLDRRDSPLVRQYAHAIYFAIMVTTANDVGPTNTTEKVFTSLMLFVGIVINASIIGSAANLLANLDKVAIARKNQMDSINDYMRFKKVPLALQDKIRRYYEYALSTRIVDPTQTLFADLPDRLKLSLRLTLHDAFIRKVPLFRVCSNAGVIAIVQCLHPVVAMPLEVILAQGEMVNEFYFIKSGRVSLCVRTVVEVPLGNLGEGSFFGETSLLTGEPQQAEVKSDAITELVFLEKADFIALIDKFPTFHLAVRRICENRMQTAQNVHRMTKMRRPSQVLQPGVPAKKVTMKSAATMVMNTSRLRPPIARRRPARRTSADLNSMHLSRRFSTSRQDSVNGTFSPNFLIHIPLSQARHFSTLDALGHLNMQSSKGDPVTDD